MTRETHTTKPVHQKRKRAFIRTFPASTCSSAVLAALGVLQVSTVLAAGPYPSLPTACSISPAACGIATTNPQFLQSGAASYANTLATGGKTGIVTQTSQQAILNWKDFNVGAGYAMQFVNPNFAAAAWSTLNRIWQADPSRIAGSITSAGQLYLLNQNGIVFANGASVDTGMLVASTLNISDNQYLTNILTPHVKGGTTTAGLLTPSFIPFKNAANQDVVTGSVAVEGGAILSAAGGKVMLFAPNVTNNGLIRTPDGQTILAAGQKVYLTGSTDPSLRGLVVEVDSGGTVTNAGSIITDRGNTTLVGMAVNQNGLISASTAVSANGSVRLLGRSGAIDINATTTAGGNATLSAVTGGTVTLGKGSVTQTLPDLNDSATIDGSVSFLPSQVTVSAQTILHQGSILAPDGVVAMTALANPSLADTADFNTLTGIGYNAASRVFLDTGSVIDVSGTPEVVLPMSSNAVAVQLRGNELRDDPLQRDGILRGKTVVIDINKGTTLGDVSGYIAAIPRTVAQKTLAGGSISITTDGAAILKSGATADVSGGQTTYQSGSIQTAKLFSHGKMYDISNAPVDLVYDGIFTGSVSITDPKWGVTQTFGSTMQAQIIPGYVQGADAGSISLRANGLVLDGTLSGTAVAGPYQRVAGKVPKGGTFSLLDFFGQGSAVGTDIRHDVKFQSGPTASTIGSTNNQLTDPLLSSAYLALSTDMLAQGGFGTINIDRHGKITLPAGVTLSVTPGSNQLDATGKETAASRLGVALKGSEMQIAGDIVAPSRDVTLTTDLSATVASPGGTPGRLAIDAGAGISTHGLWVNDRLVTDSPQLPIGPVLVDAGSISLKSDPNGTLTVGGAGTALLDVSGGGWLAGNGALKFGNGGGLSLTTSAVPALNADIRAQSLSGTGGTFSLNLTYLPATRLQGSVVLENRPAGAALAGNSMLIANAADAQQLGIAADALATLGFSAYSITTNAPVLNVADGTSVILNAPYRQLNADYALQPTGSSVWSISSVPPAPLDLLLKPVNLTLTQNGTGSDTLRVGAGAAITAYSPQAAVTLTGRGSIDVEGQITAHAGTINLAVKAVGTEVDYLPNQSIWLGQQAALDVSGVAANQQTVKGLHKGDVLAGGTVNIQADRGYIVMQGPSATQPLTQPGASINASGSAAVFDLPRGTAGAIVASTVGSDGGAINLTAAEGMVLDGNLRAAGGDAPGTAGGSLALTMSTRNRSDFSQSLVSSFPVTKRSIVLRDDDAASMAPNLHFGDAIDPSLNGQALINASKIAQGKFDRLSLTAQAAQAQDPAATAVTGDRVDVQGEVRLQGNFTLALNQAIQIDARALTVTGNATLNAAYVALGSAETDPLYLDPRNPVTDPVTHTVTLQPQNASGGTGLLTVNAGLIDLVGHSVVQGADTVNLKATGDIRARSVMVPQDANKTVYAAQGDFTTGKDLTLAAQQIYPATYSKFSLNSSGTLTTVGAPGTPGVVLSAGGTLTLNAPVINHGGVLKAPFGSLVLNGTGATGGVTLDTGSVLSVSADGQTIPYGSTQNKSEWVYSQVAADGTTVFTSTITAPPDKHVNITAKSVQVLAGAKVDVSGGGDLLAYEFVPGTGGSADVLANAKTVNGAVVQNNEYAVLPWLNSAFAAIDPSIYAGSTLKPGASVYLSGVANPANKNDILLPAGTYALLPARYALLPGAFLVKSVAGFQDIVPNHASNQRDGSVVTAGYLTGAGASGDGKRYTGFDVRAGAAALAQSEFVQSTANAFFTQQAADNGAAVARLPQDAGSLAITSTSLTLQGSLVGTHSAASRGSEVDISADQILVVSDTTNPAPAGVLQIKASELSHFGAESLLLGGTRTSSGTVDTVTVGASAVTVANDADHALTGPEVILAAKNTITVADNAVIRGAGVFKGRAQDLVIGSNDVKDANGNITQAGVSGQGALLSVASTGATSLVRNNIGNRSTGVLSVGANAVLHADGFLRLDATNSTTIDVANSTADHVTLDVVKGGALALSAGNVTIGDTTGVATGLLLPNASLDTFTNLGSLALRSYGSIDFRGPVNFGGFDAKTGARLLKSLSLEAGSVYGYDSSGGTVGDVAINAGTFSLSNPVGTSAAATPGGTGRFSVDADRITLGIGDKSLQGFNTVALVSTGEITATGAGTLAATHDLTLDAARVTGTKASSESVTAGGVVAIRQTSAQSLAAVTDLSARWGITGASIDDAGRFELPSGQLALTATGAGGNITLGRDASGRAAAIDVSGSRKLFDGQSVYAPAGTVALNSQHGDVSLSDGASINVSGAADGGNAGSLTINAPQGIVMLQSAAVGTTQAASIMGTSNQNYTGARIGIDAMTLAGNATDTGNNFNALNTLINAGGFTGERNFRARAGNLSIDGTGSDRVRAGVIQIAADAGNIDVNGTLDASGAAGGQIALWAKANGAVANSGVLTLASSATLNASGSSAKGGDVMLSSDGGSIDAKSGAVINVQGASVLVNGAETAGNGSVVMRAPRTSGVAVSSTSLQGIGGAASVVVEGVKVYDGITQIAASGDAPGTLGLGAGDLLAVDTAAFNSQAATIKSGFNPSTELGSVLHIRPGIEIRSSGDLTLATDWNLQGSNGSTWRSATGEPIVLTLRAQGNLNLNGAAPTGYNSAVLNDAFDSVAVSTLNTTTGVLTSVGKLVAGESASYRLAGGADLTAAGALAVLPQNLLATNKGDVILPEKKVVRTGNGDIAIAAGRNFELGKAASGPNQASAAVYSAGQPTATADYTQLAGFIAPGATGAAQVTTGANLVTANFAKNGGDISIAAAGNVNGAVTSQLITEWQQRIGLDNPDGTIRNLPAAGNTGRIGPYNTAWWIDYGKFKENVGALGGGNVTVRAGGDINNLSVVIPTTGRLGGATTANATSTGVLPDPGKLVVLGGGNMDVEAGSNILSGVYYTGRGTASLTAGGNIAAGRTVGDTNPNALASQKSLSVGTILAVGDGQISATATGDVRIESVLNPTAVLQDVGYASAALATRKSIFYTYSPDSAVQLTSIAGNVILSNDTTALTQSVAPLQNKSTGLPYVTATGFTFAANADSAINALTVYPGTVRVAAMQGDLQVLNSFTMYPSSKGNVNLFATGNITFASNGGVASAVNLSDADPALIVNPLFVPTTGTGGTTTMSYADSSNRLAANTDTSIANTLTHKAGAPLHATDTTGPAEIVAESGTISGGRLLFAKAARLVAGQDIQDVLVQAQNITSADVTFIAAGRDLKFQTVRDALGNQAQNNNGIYVAGPGSLNVDAGRNISLGNSTGLVTGGNATNLALAQSGASIGVTAGAAAPMNYSGFIGKYLDPVAAAANGTSYAQPLSDYLTALGKNVQGLTDAQKLALFNGLSVEQQAPFIKQVFFSELRESGRAFATLGAKTYERGTAAINALFPEGGQYRGNLSMLFSQIRTKAGGEIDILVPGGEVNVGQTSQIKDSNAKSVDKLGIVAEGTGGVFAYTQGDFNVNESRVFTLKGGDILIWSNEGDIDAGKGAKTATSAPPPTVITKPDGTTLFQFASVAGSGIRGILTDRTLTPGNVDLIAPKGVVDAGDAGIGSAGNLTIVAVRVVGADNINVAGSSSGVPAVQTTSLSGVAGVSSVPADVAKTGDAVARNLAQSASANQNSFRPNIITVEVFCLGAACGQ